MNSHDPDERQRDKRQRGALHFRLIKALSLIVSPRLRESWQGEWQAELQHREMRLNDWRRLNWRNRIDLLQRSLSAFWDALWLVPQRWEDEMIQDLRYGIRVLVKNPGFSVFAILILTLGIGANSAIFSVVNSVLLRPLPYSNPDRIMMVWSTSANANGLSNNSSPDFLDYKERSQTFAYLAAFKGGGGAMTGLGDPEVLAGGAVSADFFNVLGGKPILGRVFTAEEDRPNTPRVIVLGYDFWRRRFGADPNVLGKSLTLNGASFTIIGVMEPGFQFSLPGSFRPREVWQPLRLVMDEKLRDDHNLNVIGRLKPGLRLEQGQAELDSIGRQLQQQHPSANVGAGVKLVSLRDQVVGNVQPALLTLLGAVGFVLLIACANLANLLLARAAGRQREIAVRVALGAGRRRIIRQLLTESTILSLVGGVLGSALAIGGIKLLLTLAPGDLPRLHEIGIDGYALAVTFAISLLTGIVFGLVPALQSTRIDLNESLKGAGKASSAGPGRNRVRNILAISEIAVALVLLIGAGLMLKSFSRLRNVDLGFNWQHVTTSFFSLPRQRYPDKPRQAAFFHQAIEQVKSLPGVESVGAINDLPLEKGNDDTIFKVEGRAPLPPGQDPVTNYRIVSPDYFKTMRIPLLKGRHLTEQDRAGGTLVLLINQTVARQFFPGEDPIGKHLIMNPSEETTPPPAWEIVGIVGDIRNGSGDIKTETIPEVYVSYLQEPLYYSTLVIRTSGDSQAFASSLRHEIRLLDPDLPVQNIRNMKDIFDDLIAPSQFLLLLLGVFAILAMVLAGAGIYGIMSYSVAQRTHEFGIRMALGAQRLDVVKMVMGQVLLLVLVGVVTGWAAAFALTRFMAGLLYNVSAVDPLTFVTIAALLAGVALLASFVPARRATKVDPIMALRYE